MKPAKMKGKSKGKRKINDAIGIHEENSDEDGGTVPFATWRQDTRDIITPGKKKWSVCANGFRFTFGA